VVAVEVVVVVTYLIGFDGTGLILVYINGSVKF